MPPVVAMATVHPPVPSVVVIHAADHPVEHRANVSSSGSSNNSDSGGVVLGPCRLDVEGEGNMVGEE